MIFAHLFLVWGSFLGAVAHRAGKVSSGGAQETRGARSPLDYFSGNARQEDTLSQHMFKLYEKSSKESRLREGNTVRSFRVTPEPSDQRMVYRLNLTTLQDSEVILSVTFHFLLERRQPHKPWFCKRFKSSLCHSPAVPSAMSVSLLIRSVSSGSEVDSGSTGSLLGNVTFHPHRRGVWQMKDLTQVIKEARDRGHLLLSLEIDMGLQYHRSPAEVLSTGNLPYFLVYADDQALGEPNSVAASLQRYDPSVEARDPSLSSQHKPNTAPGRVRRALIQDNELPGISYKPDGYRKEDMLESSWYLGLKLKPGEKQKKKINHKDKVMEQSKDGELLSEAEKISVRIHNEESTKQSPGQKDERRNSDKKHKGSSTEESPLLSFDEKTMRKARRRQSSESHERTCSRRNLRVDFADIGWSEWVIAPKAFEAYYCAGTCGFPISKVTRPSNHATIQSIVRAVGIIPGIPEPCCVPEKMSPLPVLYQDEANNPVLKVYPNMSVQSCSCR
ncbi:growth/differentiation factor 10 [Boleophthalmus pectinirostris]|uniref:growth/differentiation factor 10 n=1 Tax=Boleophthalmus pectinirostris TaxID=150288 RepID=UPI000A1C5721|nr:growth/differentiation factor 10 [Boleophthalmus pectinirostris]